VTKADPGKIRREQAAVRIAERGKLSAKEQIARLDARFGAGQGAAKERAKLAAQIAEAEKS
jgi:outer membrane protein TolC